MHAFSTLYVPNGTDKQIRWYVELQRVSAWGENAIRLQRARFIHSTTVMTVAGWSALPRSPSRVPPPTSPALADLL